MPVDEKTREALALDGLQLPPSPPVARVEAEEYTDSTGEPSLRVLVVLDESADLDQVSGEDVGELKFAIRESLREHGIEVFPYIFLAKQSELDEPDDEG
ncbi:MAG: hypothetical protein DWQ34_10460 [Planctomycetota bacterium]|nr:MAG: hypothetical protein DWQ34_10460 [Planctomycetota bacterium]REK23073.1 MAG: hypothetical protein DWQ41_18030 [Planctomycetota bacterium]REK34089.1 MAG: hypothetical protein DWQ45_14060 [Planctomycetota bacterium]